MPNLYSVAISTVRPIPYDLLHSELNRHVDWLAFSASHYLVYSDSSGHEVSNSFRANLYPDDFVLVTKAEPGQLWGWVPTGTLEWIGRDRTQYSKSRAGNNLPNYVNPLPFSG